MSNKAHVSANRTMISYSVMRKISRDSLEAAKESEKYRYSNCTSAMVFSAFCLEAYYNHLGNININNWEAIERKLSPDEKLLKLAQRLNFQFDKGHRPFQTLSDIFQFRNGIAHAKTEYLRLEYEQAIQAIMASDEPKMPLTKWEEKISLDVAERFVTDMEDVIRKLHMAAKFPEDPFAETFIENWETKP